MLARTCHVGLPVLPLLILPTVASASESHLPRFLLRAPFAGEALVGGAEA